MITKEEIAQIQTFEQFKAKVTLRLFAIATGIKLGPSVPGVTDDLDSLRDMTLLEIEDRFGGFEGFRAFLRGKLDDATVEQLAWKFAAASSVRGDA